MRKSLVAAYILVLTVLIAAPFVLGANLLDNVLQPFKGINIGQTYLNYAMFIDAVIYFWFFIALSKGIFGEKFSTQVAIAVGLILGIGMGVFEYNSHFNLGMLAPFAALIFFVVLGIMLFTWAKKIGDNGLFAFSLTYIVIYSLVAAVATSLIDWINKVPLLASILQITLLVAIIGLIMGLVRMFKNISSGKAGLDKYLTRSTGDDKKIEKTSKDEKKALKKVEEAEKNILDLQRHMNDMNNALQKITNLEDQYAKKDKLTREEQATLLREIYAALNNSYRAQAAIQKVYSNVNNPEYKESKEEINGYAKVLSEYLNSISAVLLKLDQSVKDSMTNDSERKLQEETFNKNSTEYFTAEKQIEQIKKSIEIVKSIDEPEYFKILSTLQSHKATADFYSIMTKVAEEDKKILLIDQSIKELDQKNLNEIQRCLMVLSSDGTNDVSALSKGLGVLTNSAGDRNAIKDSFKESKLQGILGVINAGYKYLSDSHIRQVQSSVKDMYNNMNNIVNFMKERNTIMSDKISQTSTCKKLEDAELVVVKNAMKAALAELHQNYSSDVAAFGQLTQNYKTKIISPGVLPSDLDINKLNDFANFISTTFDSKKFRIKNRQKDVDKIRTGIIVLIDDLSRIKKGYVDAKNNVLKELQNKEKSLEYILARIADENKILADFANRY